MKNNFLVFLKQIKKVDIFILLSYLLLTIAMIFFHEPWRDELQALSIVKTSNSFYDIFEVTKYEGHPSLWFIILYIIQLFSNSILLVQFAHLSIIFCGIVIFLKKAPLNIKYKILTIFGYFFTYEYSVIFRNYGLGVTLLFLAYYFLEKKKLISASLITFLALQTNIYAVFISIALWMVIFLDYYKKDLKNLLIASFIVLIGTTFSILDIIPPSDSGFAVGYQKNLQSLFVITKAFIPIPTLEIDFWNNNIIFYYINNNSLLNIISIFILISCLYCLKESKKAQLFFIISFSLIIGFTTFKFTGSLRHHGYLFITFISSLWLKNILDKDSVDKDNTFQKYFITTILISQVISSFIAYYMDFKYNFSQAKEVKIFLEKENLSDYEIIGNYQANTSTIAGLLDKKIYYPSIEDYGINVIWNKKSKKHISKIKLLSLFENKKKINKKTLLITSYKIDNKKLLKEYNLVLIKEFNPSIVQDESFYLYK